MDWEIRAHEEEVFFFMSWSNQLDYVLFLGRPDASGINNELFSLNTSAKPEFEGQLSL